MKRKSIIGASVIAFAAVIGMTGCNKSAPEETTNTKATEVPEGGLKIAYVEIDTLMAQYNFCKDYTVLMNKKGENIRATLAGKERALQAKAAELQKKYEANQFTTKEQVEQAQMTLNKQQQDLQALNDRLTNDFAAEQLKYNNEMRDSIQAFLKEYNKTKKFDYIISKAGDNILAANAQYDITKDVVNGLNKRYKKKANLTDENETKDAQ
ncbi:MAG: OmpH family outer membrane protein [Paraprevotella sp.]|nr:OmpH family outer membrane protein [Paraprevotella sp.]